MGVDSSGVALATLQQNEGLRIPTVGAGVNSGALSSKDLFVRTMYSYDVSGKLAGAIAHYIGLRSVGAVSTSVFRTIENHLSSSTFNITSCGFVLFETGALALMPGRLDKLHTAGCRFMVSLMYSADQKILRGFSTSLNAPGVGWMAQGIASAFKSQPSFANWLGFIGFVNTTDPGYKTMRPGFDKHWLEDYNKGSGNISMSTPTIETCTGWNALIATAHALDTMFIRSSPPVLASNPAFADTFVRTIKNFTGPGAGIRIKLDSKGDAVMPFRVLNVGASQGTVEVGRWMGGDSDVYESLRPIVWPGGVTPVVASGQTFFIFKNQWCI